MKPNIKVITSSPEGFWINSTLIQGEKDAILIDAQFTMSDARRLANTITESKKNLTMVYVTHFHPDHYFGLTALREVFPDAKFVSPAIDPGGHKEDLGGQSKTVEADVWGEYPVKTGSP